MDDKEFFKMGLLIYSNVECVNQAHSVNRYNMKNSVSIIATCAWWTVTPRQHKK